MPNLVVQASQLDAGDVLQMELDTSLYAQLLLDRALSVFETTLNDTVMARFLGLETDKIV